MATDAKPFYPETNPGYGVPPIEPALQTRSNLVDYYEDATAWVARRLSELVRRPHNAPQHRAGMSARQRQELTAAMILLFGVICASIGSFIQFGPGYGMMVSGAMLIAFGFLLARSSGDVSVEEKNE